MALETNIKYKVPDTLAGGRSDWYLLVHPAAKLHGVLLLLLRHVAQPGAKGR